MSTQKLPCRTHQDPDIWYSMAARKMDEAVQLCHTCPIRPACLRYALESGERYGVWGGLTEDQRQAITGPPKVGRPAGVSAGWAA